MKGGFSFLKVLRKSGSGNRKTFACGCGRWQRWEKQVRGSRVQGR